MSGYFKYLPSVLQAIGINQAGAADERTLKAQAMTARAQAQAEEEMQRREARQVAGAQAAAFAQAGGGFDENIGRQSALSAELDALNIRYAGQLRGAGISAQAAAVRKKTGLEAGAALLQGVTDAYTGTRKGR